MGYRSRFKRNYAKALLAPSPNRVVLRLERPNWRRRLAPVALAVIVAGLTVVAVVYLSQGQRAPSQPPVRVAGVGDITAVPTEVSVTMQLGADRLQQRAQYGLPCSASVGPVLGCPESTPLRAVPVFLVRDDQDQVHAFIGQDPRNSCRLTVRTDLKFGTFYDPCHGSIYNRYGVVVGGPSQFNLNEVGAEVRGGELYLDPTRLVIGACPGCR